MSVNISHTKTNRTRPRHAVTKESRIHGCKSHQFSCEESQSVRTKLLGWYHTNKRDLPWRHLNETEQDKNRRGYAVWVSEVMLQQTQVATVVEYYNRWMKKWPTLQDLSKATLEEVNEMWAGLGYYSRARRLYEGSQKVLRLFRQVMKDMNGEMPGNAADLIKHLPGVGKYTAGAIASIAFNEPTGVVDGNVIRVLSRLRVIGADTSSSLAMDTFWKLVGEILDKERPGDFNQAMMELGATVCTPKSPQCQNCPVKDTCLAYKQTELLKTERQVSGLKSYFKAKDGKEIEKSENNDSPGKFGIHLEASNISKHVKSDSAADIEDLVSEDCLLCIPNDESWKLDLGVCNYPRKQKLKEARREKLAVCILECRGQDNKTKDEAMILVCKRPDTGLLAGLWEFPNVVIERDISENVKDSKVQKFLKDEFSIVLEKEKIVSLGEVQHQFSHIHHTYMVQKIVFEGKPPVLAGESKTGRGTKWMKKSDFMEAAVSTAMKKVFNWYNSDGQAKNKGAGIKRKFEGKDGKRKQRVLDSFFVRK